MNDCGTDHKYGQSNMNTSSTGPVGGASASPAVMHHAPYAPPPAPVMTPVIMQPRVTTINPNKKTPLVATASIQMVLGILMLGFNIAAIPTYASLTMYGVPGIWLGIYVIVTAGIGIGGGKHLHRGSVIAYMVLSIISSVLQWILIGCAATGLGIDANYQWDYNWDYYYHASDAALAMNSLLLICGFAEFVTAVVASAYCCAAVCCGQTQPRHIQAIHPTQPPSYVIVPQYQQQYMQPYQQQHQLQYQQVYHQQQHMNPPPYAPAQVHTSGTGVTCTGTQSGATAPATGPSIQTSELAAPPCYESAWRT